MPRSSEIDDLARCLAAMEMESLQMAVSSADDGTCRINLMIQDPAAAQRMTQMRERFAPALLRALSSLEMDHPHVILTIHDDGRVDQVRVDPQEMPLPDPGEMFRSMLREDLLELMRNRAPTPMPDSAITRLAQSLGAADHGLVLQFMGEVEDGAIWRGVAAGSSTQRVSVEVLTDANELRAARIVVLDIPSPCMSPDLASALGRTGAPLALLEGMVARPDWPRSPQVLHGQEIPVTGTSGLGRLALLLHGALSGLAGQHPSPETISLSEGLARGRLAVFLVNGLEPVHLSVSP